MKPILTIILPVGDLRPTLFSSIATVLDSTSSEFELLISDNSLNGIAFDPHHGNDPRVKIVRQQARLSMSDHWLQVMEIANADWICFMGSDDGIISANLQSLIDEIRESDSDVINTHRVEAFTTEESIVTWAVVPASPCSRKANQIRWNILLASLFPQFFFELPMPYNKAVFRKNIIDEFVKSGSGLYSLTPDYFLAFLVALKSRFGIQYDLPVFIHGSSEFSNGWQIQNAKKTENLDDFISRLPENDGYILNQSHDCVLGWLANSYLTSNFPKSGIKNRSQRFKLILLIYFFKLWIKFTCVYCQSHTDQKTPRTLKLKIFIIDKFCSFIRNYILPRTKYRQPSHHEGIYVQGDNSRLISNLEEFF
jgi:glycosyltransferase involved in cell wall biosynthesis